MNLLTTARQKLEHAITTIKQAQDYTQSITPILASLDDGLQFTKQHYSELNALTMAQAQNLKGSDIYFFFMRFTHQFFNIMNAIHSLPNASYYEKFLNMQQVRQQGFVEICSNAIAKAEDILRHT